MPGVKGGAPMPVLEGLKRWFAGGKKSPQAEYWEGLDKRISELEHRLRISHEDKILVGDLAMLEETCDEILHTLGEEGEQISSEPRAELARRRVELFRTVARMLTSDVKGRSALWSDFAQRLAAVRDGLHYKTRVKYDRLRLDYESNRYR